MSMKNRVIRFATALTVAGLISAQIPMSGGTALAADGGCSGNNGGKFLGTSLTNEQVFSGVTIGILGYSLLKTLRDKGKVVTPPSGGGGMAGGGTTPPAMGVADCLKATVVGDGSKSLYDLVAGSNNLSALKGLIDEAGIADTLKTEGPFTVVAPNNATLGQVPGSTLSALRADKAKLADLLTTHTIIGRYKYEDFCKMGEKNLLTLSGKTVKLTNKDGKVLIDGFVVSPVDITGSNGYAHMLGGVIAK
jgi:uncharacterized surface protein with fasciclin (FAS1) repeats